MMTSDLIERLEELSPFAVAAIAAVAAALIVVVIAVWLSVRELRRSLSDAEEDLVDAATALLPRSAIGPRLGAELAWGSTSATPVSVAVIWIRTGSFTEGARVLRAAMREEEQAFLLGDRRIVLELWGVDVSGASFALWRLGAALERAGFVADGGVVEADGAIEIEPLVRDARRHMRPIDEVADAVDIGSRRATLGPLLAHVGVWWIAALAMYVVGRHAFDRVTQAALAVADQTAETADLVVVGGVACVLPLLGTIIVVSSWNRLRPPLVRPRPAQLAGWITALTSMLVLLASVGAVLIGSGDSVMRTAIGSAVGVVTLSVLVLFVGRGTYQARSWLLALLALGSSAYLLAPLDFSGDVDAAHLARLVFVTSIASLVVRHLRRAGLLLTAMIGLGALGATAHVMSVDVGAAIASFVREAASSPFELVDRERYSPVAALNIQLLDLLIIAFMLTWAHDWRIDIRGVLAATALAITTWIIAVAVTESFVPLAAVLAVMYVCLVAITALIRRQRRFRV